MLTRSMLLLAGLLMPSAAFAQSPAPAADLPYGPDTCKQGYVWREATPEDHVCVTPEMRAQAKRDNAQARYRISATDRTYGENTCRQGYVWREAVEGDLVCVTPEMRAQVRADNAAAVSRYVSQ